MRQVTRKGLMTVAAATGVLAAAGGYAHADSGASGYASDSPGVLSGNNVQAPVNVPVNVCGNTVDVVGILNPAVGNSCTNRSTGHGDGKSGGGSHAGHDDGGSGSQTGPGGHGGSGTHTGTGGHGGSGSHAGPGGAHAGGHTAGSPGVGSGNNVQAPVDVPVNACGNTIDVVGILNPALGNNCANDSGPGPDYGTPPGGEEETPGTPGPGKPSHSQDEVTPAKPGHATPAGHSSVHSPQLAQTGSGLPLGLALPAGAGALLAGAVLYRKARAAA
ncbi:chaplin [Streptomyces sp. NPDC088766]|uniref:chaplin n=1 Tax=Streptomyces sp. NPDC088766 TaxID=3365893 RepID=UPI003821F948